MMKQIETVTEDVIEDRVFISEPEEEKMILRTEDLVKKYRQRTVVNHVSIDVTQGEILSMDCLDRTELEKRLHFI